MINNPNNSNLDNFVPVNVADIKPGKRSIIVCVNLKRERDFAELVAEGVALVESAGFTILDNSIMNRNNIDSKYFIGSGKVEELKVLCKALLIETVFINHNLSPIQERNLELALNLPVIDRTRLILEIFANRVTLHEGILQVELASLSHQLTRLVRKWTHLERQKGGIGLRGGPGETQMELDKRMIRDKIKILKKRLDSVVKQRQTIRKSRIKHNTFSISIVGYTNAGKSTLFNCLTKAKVHTADKLFATLQTTSRKLFINETEKEVIISDTVGFIRELPHTLVAAFRATLEETVGADLLLHVVDFSQLLKERQISDVNKVLLEIQANKISQLIIYNKIDLKSEFRPRIDYNETGEPIAVYISAAKSVGLDLLRLAINLKISTIKNKVIEKQGLVYEPWTEKTQSKTKKS